MQYLLGLFGLLLGAFGFNYFKRKSAEALLQNNEVKSKLNEQDKYISQNEGLLLTEEEKRANLNKENASQKDEPVKPSDF